MITCTCNQITPKVIRARLTITDDGGACVVSVPAGPWLRRSGEWYVLSRRVVAGACRAAGVAVPTDDEITAAITDAIGSMAPPKTRAPKPMTAARGIYR